MYTAGISEVATKFNLSTSVAILGMSLYLFGIHFAPIYTPHVAERVGRSIVYLTSLFLFALFTLGAGLSTNFGSLAVCRFFAGLSGGPCLVLIEGTFADIWSAETTNTYYSILGLASYVGAAVGMAIVPAKFYLDANYHYSCRTYSRRFCCCRERMAMDTMGHIDDNPRRVYVRRWHT